MPERVTCHRDDLAAGVRVKTGKVYEYKFGEPLGEIHVLVRDHEGHNPVHNEKFKVSGPHGVSFEGKTGPRGEVDRAEPKVPIDHYQLELPDVSGDKKFDVLAMNPGLSRPPLVVRVPGWPKAGEPPTPADDGRPRAKITDRLRVTGWCESWDWHVPNFVEKGWVDSVIWMLYQIEPIGHRSFPFSRKGGAANNFMEWPEAFLRQQVQEIHDLGGLVICEWARARPDPGDGRVVHGIISDAGASRALQDAIIADVDKYNWDGVDFDVESIGSGTPESTRPIAEKWMRFLSDLADKLHAKEKLLTVTPPGRWDDRGGFCATWAHDWTAMGRFADWITCMGYDNNNNLPLDLQRRIIDYASRTCGLDKFCLGVDGAHIQQAPDLKQRAQLCKNAGCGFGLWRMGERASGAWPWVKNRWREIVKVLNGGEPPASFENQPKQTPRWWVDHLNKKSPPAP